MWVGAEEKQLNPNELKNNLLVARDKYGFNACQRAAEQGRLEALETLWIWTTEAELNTV